MEFSRLALATLLISVVGHAAPNVTQPVSGSIVINAQTTWGTMVPKRTLRSKIGGAVIVLKNGDNLLVRRLTSIPSSYPYPMKDLNIATKSPGKPLQARAVEEDNQGNIFLFYSTDGVLNSDRLAKIDAQGTLAFDIAPGTQGCFDFAPDGAGGVYIQNYAPKLAQGFAFNTGRPRVVRLSPTGTQLWENISPVDYKYHAEQCAIAKGASGAYAAFSFVGPPGSLDQPGEIHFVNVSEAGALVGSTDNISITGGGVPTPMTLSLDAKQIWNLNGPVLLGRQTKTDKYYLVRYDAQNKPTGAIEAWGVLTEYQGALYKFSSSQTQVGGDRYNVSGAGFTKTPFTIKDVASKPEHTFTGVSYDGNGMFVFYGKTNTNLPVLGFAKMDGTKYGSYASGSGNVFTSPNTMLLENGNFFFLDVKDGSPTMANAGKYVLPSSGGAPIMGTTLNTSPAPQRMTKP